MNFTFSRLPTLTLFFLPFNGERGWFIIIRAFVNRCIFQIRLYSCVFFIVLVIISIFVFKFSSIYIRNEAETKFFIVVTLSFVFSILILIFGNDFLSLFIGWEGLGISSFVLVDFYRTFYCFNASIKTIIINRIGDSFFLTRICII